MAQAEFDADEPRWSDSAEAPAAGRRMAVAEALRALLPADCVLSGDNELRPYECDGLSVFRQQPLLVVLPRTEAELRAVLMECRRLGVPVVARGAGTGLSGGAMPHACGVVLSLARFDRILEINAWRASRACSPACAIWPYRKPPPPMACSTPPDPSSQIACSIGGNVAENSGGVHCLKYGLTLHNVLGLRGCTIDGEPIELGGGALDAPGLDLLALSSARRACCWSSPR